MSRRGFQGIVLLGAVVTAVLCARGPAAQEGPPRPRSLAVLEARSLDVSFDRIELPAFSPSGEAIAFSAAAADGHRHIFVVPASGGAPRALTSGEGEDSSPRYSPDGRRIA